MPFELVKTVIEVGFKIKNVLEKFKGNNKECDQICDLVKALTDDLKLLQGAPIMKDHGVHAAMERLKNALENMLLEVNESQSSNGALKAFKADDIARNLDGLRQDISEKIFAAVLLTTVSTNTQVQQMEHKMDEYYAAARAFLLPLRLKLEQLVQHFGIRDSQRTGDGSTGLIDYNWSELEAAIASKEDIGGGLSSSVYKCELHNQSVAIKKFKVLNEYVKERFVRELKLIVKLRHGNIFDLVGYCYEYNESLVQEGNDVRIDEQCNLGFVSRYMPNQSLARIIQGNIHVDWPYLFRIIQGVARGIHYLHQQHVVHLDLKPENILLEADMTPKINDCGKALALEPSADKITLDVRNLPGLGTYMAPELSKERTVSTKSDVYSFGIILLETMGLMCATSERGCPKGHNDWSMRMEKSELRDLFDSNKVNGDSQLTLATRCVLVGLLCSLPDPAGRPSMQTVLDMLDDSHVGEKENTNTAGTSSSSSSIPDGSTSVCNKETSYEVLTEDNLRDRQGRAIAMVHELLSIPLGLAEVLLRHCNWDPDQVQEGWYGVDGDYFRIAIGLPRSLDDVSGPKVARHSELMTCRTCFFAYSWAGADTGGMTTRSAGCSHFYCDQCWHRYIVDAVDTGPNCLSLRCPESNAYPSCQVPVIRELVEMVADVDAKAQYGWYAFRSYVDDSGGRIKWCQGPGCSRAIEFLGCGTDSADVVCHCSHACCWRCSKEPHWPVSCDTARAWMDKERPEGSMGDSRYWRHYQLWEDNQTSVHKALADMDELKQSWLGNMAAELGIRATDLDFLTEAYEEIVECWRAIRWVHAYGYFLDPERDWTKCGRLDDLQKQASESLERLHHYAEEERVKLCAADVEAITEMYLAFKTKLIDLTRETRQDFEKLVEAVKTDFKD